MAEATVIAKAKAKPGREADLERALCSVIGPRVCFKTLRIADCGLRIADFQMGPIRNRQSEIRNSSVLKWTLRTRRSDAACTRCIEASKIAIRSS